MSDPESSVLLVIEDDAAALRQLRWTFEDCEVLTAKDRREAVQQAKARRPGVVLLDLGLPPDAEGASEGLAALREILSHAPETKVVVVTGREEREHALEAVGLGAYDFYRKPIEAEELRFLVRRAFRLYHLERENRRLAQAATVEPLPGVIARSDGMAEVCRLVERAASSDISVLLTGESGTGKEVLARALHERSSRRQGPFVAINCAAIPEHLLESELFGHERGAFTGAVRRSVGRLELARGGTLLLDEIGDMPGGLQAKVLRFLQERVVQRVGGREEIHVDVRVVSASHRDLKTLVAEGGFREDLYYRISELEIAIPPLRDRGEDALLLARHFFDRFRRDAGRPLQSLGPDAVSAVLRHSWPGNVRELENRLKRAVVISEGPRLTAADLDLGSLDEGPPPSLQEAVRHAERRAVERAWAEAGGNVSRAGKILGVSRPTVYKLLKEHGFRE
jgi:two-component system NtrC family response regulator